MFKQKGLFKTSVLIMLFSIAIASLFTLFTNEAIAAEDNSATVEINLLETNKKPEGLIEKDTIKVSPHSDSVKASFYYEKVEEDNNTKPDSSKTDSNTKPSSQTNSKNKATTADTSDTKAHALVIASISIVGILSILKGKDLKKVAGVLAIVVGLTTVFSAPYAYATNTTYKIGDTIKIEGKTGKETTFQAPALKGYKVIGYTIDSNPYFVSYVDAFDESNPQTIATYKVEENNPTPKLDKELPVHEGYKLDGWEPALAETVVENKEYQAVWKELTYTVSASSNELGKVDVDNKVVKHNGSATATFTANENAQLVKVLVNDSEIDLSKIKDNTLKLENITQDTTIKAEFALNQTPVIPIPNVNTELIEVKVGTKITNDTYKNAIKLADDATDDLIDSVELVGDGIDTSKINKGSVKVKVTFESGSSRVVDVEYSVFDDPGTIIPIPSITTQKITLTQFDKVDNSTYLLGIKDLPEGAKVEVKDNHITTESVHEGKTKVKVIFSDGSARPVDIDYEVIPLVCTVTYKDGLDGKVFKNQVDKVNYGEKTPKFNGEHNREGYEFDGWEPEVEDTVTRDITYTAKWVKVHTVTINLATQKAFGLNNNYKFIDDDKAKANGTKTKAQWRDIKQKEYASYIDLETLNLKVDEVEKKLTKDDLNDKGQIILTVKDGSKISLGTPEISRYFTFENWSGDLNNPITKDIEINASWDDTWYFYMDEDSKEGVITLDKPSESLNYQTSPEKLPCDLMSLKCDKPIILYHASEMFKCCTDLTDISGLENWDITNTTSIFSMFNHCRSIKELSPLSNWDTSNVTCFSFAFSYCYNLKDVSALEKWDATNATTMWYMFASCSMTDISALKNWKTPNLSSMGNMFNGCSNLVDISALKNWNVSNVTCMSALFRDCSKLEDISSLKDWKTSNLSQMGDMFNCCSNLVDASALKDWETSNVKYMADMFYRCSSLKDVAALKDWNTSNVESMRGMFCECQSINSLSGLEKWDVSNVSSVAQMFDDCSNLVEVSALKDWETSNVESMPALFRGCSNLVDISALKGWDTSNVESMSHLFRGCHRLTDISALNEWKTSSVYNMEGMFECCYKLANISALNKWKTTNTKFMANIFKECHSLKDISPIKDWDSSNVRNMEGMFKGCFNLKDLSALKDWKTPNLSSMENMFWGCSNLVDISALKGWDTSNVESMSHLFKDCHRLTDISALNEWKTPNVTHMFAMFYDCRSLTDLSALANWDTSNVGDMGSMFYLCKSINDLSPIENWNVSKVTNMRYIFNECPAENKPSWYKK